MRWVERSAISITTAFLISTSLVLAGTCCIKITATDVYRCYEKAGVADGRWSSGATFADYDGDGFLDLVVSNYVDFKLNDLPGFGSLPTCKFRGY